jgi:hypothetical protein
MSGKNVYGLYSDVNIDDVINDAIEPKGGSVRELLRGTNNTESITKPVELQDKILPSQLAYRIGKMKSKDKITRESIKGDLDQVADFLNIQRQSRANYLRDLYQASPDFLEPEF